MKTCHILFLGFFSALWDGNAGVSVFQKPEGGTFTMLWKFSSCASRRFFCRRECKGGDILIDTSENTTHSGRYSVECKKAEPAGGMMSVTMTELIQSDSGRYRFGVGGYLDPDSYGEFDIRVFKELEFRNIKAINIHSGAEGGQVSVSCLYYFSKNTKFFCKGECEDKNVLLDTTDDQARSGRYSLTYEEESAINTFILRVTITDLNKSDSGLYTCGLGESLSSASFQEFEISVTDAPVTDSHSTTSVSGSFSTASPEITDRWTVPSHVSHPAFFWCLVLRGPAIVLLFAVVLLLLYKLKTNRNKEKVGASSRGRCYSA